MGKRIADRQGDFVSENRRISGMKTTLFVDFDGVFHAMDSRDLEYCGNALVVADNPALFQWVPLLWQIIEPYPVAIVFIRLGDTCTQQMC